MTEYSSERLRGSVHLSIIEGFEAAPFIKKWHYSKSASMGSHIYFGWFVDQRLYAVADYGLPTNAGQVGSLSGELMINITRGNLVELKRLARVEPRHPTLQLTQFLAMCHRSLKRHGVLYVVSFSDPAVGHSGGIYKAANFEHIGQTAAGLMSIDRAGRVHHRKYVYHYAKNNGITTEEACVQLGIDNFPTPPKDRWLLCLDKRQRKWSL